MLQKEGSWAADDRNRENKVKQKLSLRSYLLFILLRFKIIPNKSRLVRDWEEIEQSFLLQPLLWKYAWEPLSTLAHLCPYRKRRSGGCPGEGG